MSLLESEQVSCILEYLTDIEHFLKNSEKSRRELGLLIRNLKGKSLGNSYYMAILFSLSTKIQANIKPSVNEHLGKGHPEIKEEKEIQEIVQEYEEFMKLIDFQNLKNAHELKPILDGRQLCTIANIKPGPIVTILVEKMIIWQLENPDVGVNECTEWVLQVIVPLILTEDY